MKRSTLLLARVFVLAGAAISADAQVIRTNQGFHSQVVERNDDGSSDSTSLGFTINFFGKIRDSVYVNNNGNLTFDSALPTYTPFGLQKTSREIIAPFFADVDTRGVKSALVTYGQDKVNGRKAFGANYVDVGYFRSHDDKVNRFQVVVIDRSDTGPGNFTIEFNYEKINWETGDASGGVNGFGGVPPTVGWSNGTTDEGTSFELPGSMVAGAFLNSGSRALIRGHLNTSQIGRLVFQARGGVISPGLAIDGGPGLPTATVGQSYGYSLSATGVESTVKWDLVPDISMPDGIRFSSGKLTGLPTTPGTYTFTVSATADVEGELVTVYQRKTMTIGVSALAIRTACPVPAATVGQFYSTNFSTVGSGAVLWGVDDRNSLPPGLVLSASGQLSGAPAVAGGYGFTVRATANDASGALPAQKFCILTVNPATVRLAGGCALPDATIGVPYSQALISDGGVGPYRFTLIGQLPFGLSLSSDGRVAGLPQVAGAGPFQVEISDSRSVSIRQTCTLSVTDAALTITSACPLPRGTTGTAYSAPLAASGGAGPYSWSVSGGSLPSGLTLGSGNAISGTPMRAGPFTFRLIATDSTGQQAGLACSLPVQYGRLGISGCPLPEATPGDAYRVVLLPAGGSEPFTWSLSGALPPGLQISSSGVVEGKLTTAGDFQFGLSLRDNSLLSVAQPCSMKVRPLALRVSSVGPSATANMGLPYSARFNAAGGTPPYRYEFFGYLPDGLTGSSDGTVSGIPSKVATTSFGIRAVDSLGATAVSTSSIEVVLPDLPAVSIAKPPAIVAPASADVKIGIDLDRAYSLPIGGQLVLTLSPDTQNLSATANQPDPRVRFNNGQLSITFLIPAGARHVDVPLFSTGTVATTMTVSIRNLRTGGVDFIAPVSAQTFRVRAVPPILNSACFVKSDVGIQISVLGSTTTREVTLGEVGAGKIARVVNLDGASSDYFGNDGTIRFGGAFTLQFDADSALNDSVGPFSVRLSNTVGWSGTLTAQACR